MNDKAVLSKAKKEYEEALGKLTRQIDCLQDYQEV